MLKVGLIGAGFMGGMHAACYEALNEFDVKICAVADLVNEKAVKIADKFDATVYATGEELIEKADVDIIDICLPTYLHSMHAVKAMNKGRAVFIEKPVCLTLDEGKLLLETQSSTGAQVMIGQCIRFWSEYEWLKNAVETGAYGEVASAVFTRISPKPTWAWDGWLLDPGRSGSAALDLHIHDTDFIRHLFGEPHDVASDAARDSAGVIDHIVTAYKYPDKLVSAEGAWGYPGEFPFSMEYRVKFKNATAVYKAGNYPTLSVYTEDGQTLIPEIEKESMDSDDLGGNVSDLGGYFNELKYFTDRVRKNITIEKSTLTESVKSLELVIREIKNAGGQEPLY